MTRKFYIYCRISHLDQEKGESVDGQITRGKLYFETHFKEQGVEWGGVFQEPGHVSASAVPFMRRKAGREAALTLRVGDVLYVDKVDRLWRDIHDFSDLLRWFKHQQIGIVFGNLLGATFEMDSPMGEFMLPLLVLLSQLESAQTGDRIRSNFAFQRSNGFFPAAAQHAPLGTKAIQAVPLVKTALGRPKKMLAWDIPTRLIMAEIVQRYDIGKQTWEQISEAVTLKAEGYVSRFQKHRQWSPRRCAYAYVLEKEYALVQNPRFLNTKSLPTMTEACVRVQAPFVRGPYRKKRGGLSG